MVGQIKGLIAAYAGFSGLRRTTEIIRQADQAAFNMQTSVAAASREFGNSVGSVDLWEETVRRLSGELVIYSDTSLKNAVSRMVDMTKRLGLSKAQMEEVIKRRTCPPARPTWREASSGLRRRFAAKPKHPNTWA